jgi:hypothetical protein
MEKDAAAQMLSAIRANVAEHVADRIDFQTFDHRAKRLWREAEAMGLSCAVHMLMLRSGKKVV